MFAIDGFTGLQFFIINSPRNVNKIKFLVEMCPMLRSSYFHLFPQLTDQSISPVDIVYNFGLQKQISSWQKVLTDQVLVGPDGDIVSYAQ